MTQTGEFERHNLEVDREMEVGRNCRTIEVYFETWFDVVKKFNLPPEVNDEDGTWVNMYGHFNPFEDTITVTCILSRDNKEESFSYNPTVAEAALMKQLITERILKEYNVTPQDFCRQWWPVLTQEDALSDGLLVYLTNRTGERNQMDREVDPETWAWIEKHFCEDYGCHCYGSIWSQRAGILLSREFYPEDCSKYLPEVSNQGMNALADRMVDWVVEIEKVPVLRDCTIFVLTNTDTATIGDTCHELCCFIPANLALPDDEIVRIIHSFAHWVPEVQKQ